MSERQPENAMADLTALYREYGLQGVIPHAFQRGSDAYTFLLDRLKNGDPIFVTYSTATDLPFLDMEGETVLASAFSTQEEAQKYSDSLARTGVVTEPRLLQGEKNTAAFFLRLQDLGVSALKLNQGVKVFLEDLQPPAEYDGLKDLDHPLRNATMNAALCLLCQNLTSGARTDNLTRFFFQCLRHGEVLVPVLLNTERAGALDPNNIQIPYLRTDREDIHPFAIFTDAEFFLQFEKGKERKTFPHSLFYVADCEFLKNMITLQDNTVLVVNPGTCDLVLDQATFLALGAADSGIMQDTAPQTATPEDEDPVPDFLK